MRTGRVKDVAVVVIVCVVDVDTEDGGRHAACGVDGLHGGVAAL